MRIKNNLGHPLYVTTEKGAVMVMVGESDIPENVLLDLSNVKGQFAEWVAQGLVEITSLEPTKTKAKSKAEQAEDTDEEPAEEPKKKGFFKK